MDIRVCTIIAVLLFLVLSVQCSRQGVSLEKAEKEMLKSANDGEMVHKQEADLNGDEKGDIILSCGCGEMRCIRVYLQINGQYVEAINTACSNFSIHNSGYNKTLQLTENTCCGESPFISTRVYEFNRTSAVPVENYIETNGDYTGNRKIKPSVALLIPYDVTVLNDNYNLRFSPDTDVFEDPNDVMFICQPETNIIATLKARSKLKVLAEKAAEDRVWLYVEAGEDALKDRCYITSFFMADHPAVRGWVSSRYVEKE